jgi:hypothetical protein
VLDGIRALAPAGATIRHEKGCSIVSDDLSGIPAAVAASGKLTISFPAHVGQQPVFNNQVRGQNGNRDADLTQEPLFPFGHGVSCTRTAARTRGSLRPPSRAAGRRHFRSTWRMPAGGKPTRSCRSTSVAS